MFDVVLLSRIQFALMVMFHYLFPPLTIGMGAAAAMSQRPMCRPDMNATIDPNTAPPAPTGATTLPIQLMKFKNAPSAALQFDPEPRNRVAGLCRESAPQISSHKTDSSQSSFSFACVAGWLAQSSKAGRSSNPLRALIKGGVFLEEKSDRLIGETIENEEPQ